MKGKYLITTFEWFTAPDGRQYKAVWGEVTILDDSRTLGVKTNAKSTNWYARVEGEKNHMIVTGCQIQYAIQTDEKPNTSSIHDYSISSGELKEFVRPTTIYIV